MLPFSMFGVQRVYDASKTIEEDPQALWDGYREVLLEELEETGE